MQTLQFHRQTLEDDLAHLQRRASTVGEEALAQIQAHVDAYKQEFGTADSIRVWAMACVATFGWIGTFAGIGGTIAALVAIFHHEASWLALPCTMALGLAAAYVMSKQGAWMDRVAGAYWAARQLKSELKPLNSHLRKTAENLCDRSRAARSLRDDAEESTGLRYFHLQAMHALTGTQTIEESVAEDHGDGGAFQLVVNLIGLSLFTALLGATIYYSAFASQH